MKMLFMASFFVLFGCSNELPPSQEDGASYGDVTSLISRDAGAAHQAFLARIQAAGVSEDTLGDAAGLTYASYARAVSAGELERSDSIPPLYWAEKIRELNPIRVYSHRANLVVVQKEVYNVEEGTYIYNSGSSYLPVSGDDGYVFIPNPVSGSEYHLTESLDFVRTHPAFFRTRVGLTTNRKVGIE